MNTRPSDPQGLKNVLLVTCFPAVLAFMLTVTIKTASANEPAAALAGLAAYPGLRHLGRLVARHRQPAATSQEPTA